MHFLSTSILTAISTFIKLASGLVVNKIIAIYIGPTGIALIGQFQNFLSIINTVGTGAINSGVTKYVAEYHDNSKNRSGVINAAFTITFCSSLLIGIIIFFLSSHLSLWILKNVQFVLVFRVLGLTLIFISLNTVVLSIINGYKRIKLFITINITSSLLSLVITSFLSIQYGVQGALLSTVVVQSLVFFISMPLAIKKLNIRMIFFQNVEKLHLQKLFSFSVMAIVSTISVSITQIVIRNHLIQKFSIEQAGYWQSVWMISSMYLMVLTTAFSTYYLPKLSELKKTDEIRREILSGYKIILPFVFVTGLMIYLLRDFIIQILFTPDFIEMRNLFAFQLMGDFFKMASWTLAYLMIAKAMTKTFIVTEILFSVLFYIGVILFTNINGIVGVTQAYALNYFVYLVLIIIIFRKYLGLGGDHN